MDADDRWPETDMTLADLIATVVDAGDRHCSAQGDRFHVMVSDYGHGNGKYSSDFPFMSDQPLTAGGGGAGPAAPAGVGDGAAAAVGNGAAAADGIDGDGEVHGVAAMHFVTSSTSTGSSSSSSRSSRSRSSSGRVSSSTSGRV
jgi:hypothetical protein